MQEYYAVYEALACFPRTEGSAAISGEFKELVFSKKA